MKQFKSSFEQYAIASYLLKWTLLVFPVAAVVGSMVALFLWSLEVAIHYRFIHPWLLYLLPLAGIFIYLLYTHWGKNAEQGNNLIINEIHNPAGSIPLRMAPLVLFTTVITHLFGGSAGREGTAVQIGGSIAQFFSKKLKLSADDTGILLMSGVAAGFGAVFGTPVTGAIFALEVITLGKIKYKALMPCFIASVLGDLVCTAWGIQHTAYNISFTEQTDSLPVLFHINPLLLLKVIVAGVAFGFAGYLFAETTHLIKIYSHRWVHRKWMIPALGGLTIILLATILGTEDYLSLGVANPHTGSVSILSSFNEGGATTFSWFWKLLFTAITIGTGFKGGEVTPLFFIGATLGNTIADLSGAPVDLMAGLGFIAVFAAATNTPIACTIMGIELFGGDHILYYAVACFTAYYFSGHSGIYAAQRIGTPKSQQHNQYVNTTLQQIKEKKKS